MAKMCPLVSRADTDEIDETIFLRVDCKTHKCELWTETHTTEGKPIARCAFVVSAMKDPETGKYAV